MPGEMDAHYIHNVYGVVNTPGGSAGLDILYRTSSCLRHNTSSCLKEEDEYYVVGAGRLLWL